MLERLNVENRLRFVDCQDFFLYRANDTERVARGANDQAHPIPWSLKVREIDFRACRRVQSEMLYVSDHANDLPELWIVGIAEIQSAADRAFAGPEASRHCFVDGDN